MARGVYNPDPQVRELRGDASDLQVWEISRDVRAKRKLLRDAMKSGKVNAYRVLRNETGFEAIEQVAGAMRLRQILRYVPGIGSSLTFEIIAAFDCSAETRLGQLTQARRDQLADITKGASGVSPS